MNWKVRVYSLTDEQQEIANWTISDRSESEAFKEAAADVERDHPGCDWTLVRL